MLIHFPTKRTWHSAMRASFLLSFCTVLFGCGGGTAVILQEDSQELVELAQDALTSARTFYMEQALARYDYLIEFLAARPSCKAVSPLLLHATEDRCLSDDEITRRRDCEADVSDASNECDVLRRTTEVVVSIRSTQPRQTTLSLITIVAAYQNTLAKILEDEAFDTAADLSALNSRIGELKNQLEELKSIFDDSGSATSSSGNSADTNTELEGQIAAVGAIGDLIRSAEADKKDIQALKKTILTNGPKIDSTLESLLATYEQVDRPFADLLERRAIESARNKYNRMSTEKRAKMSNTARAAQLKSIYNTEFERLTRASSPDPLAEAIRGLIVSHKNLQEGFRGNLTPEQKRRIAKENREQLKATFKSILNVVKVFI